jgi:alcohol dehydrogenase
MKAPIYHGPGHRSWEDATDPQVTAATDAIVRVDAVTICGTDLHMLKGDMPAAWNPAGSSATASAEHGRSTSACRSPTPRPTCFPPGVADEAALMLADILPTAYEVGVLNGRVRPGDTVVVVGAGPIGLAAIPETFELCTRLVRPGGAHGVTSV